MKKIKRFIKKTLIVFSMLTIKVVIIPIAFLIVLAVSTFIVAAVLVMIAVPALITMPDKAVDPTVTLLEDYYEFNKLIFISIVDELMVDNVAGYYYVFCNFQKIKKKWMNLKK